MSRAQMGLQRDPGKTLFVSIILHSLCPGAALPWHIPRSPALPHVVHHPAVVGMQQDLGKVGHPYRSAKRQPGVEGTLDSAA